MKSIKQIIADKTQCNFRLNRRVLRFKKSWDEVSFLLGSFCLFKKRLMKRSKRKGCHCR